MLNQEERLALLKNAVARRVAGPDRWQRRESEADGSRPAEAGEYWYEIRSDRREGQRPVILLRPDGHVQVEYHVAKPGSPFEALFTLEEGHETAAAEAVAAFVADLLDEQLALGYAKGFWQGGRRFLKVDEVSPSGQRLRWVTSWRGTYDWP